MKRLLITIAIICVHTVAYSAPAFRIIDRDGHELEVTQEGFLRAKVVGNVKVGSNSIVGDNVSGLGFSPNGSGTNSIIFTPSGNVSLQYGEMMTNPKDGTLCLKATGTDAENDICFDLNREPRASIIGSTSGIVVIRLDVGLAPMRVDSNPCVRTVPGAIFSNAKTNRLCYCDDDQPRQVSDDSNCFK